MRLDDLRVQALVWQGNVPEWRPTWDKSGNDSTVPLEGAGPLAAGDAVRLTSAGTPELTAGEQGAEVLIWVTT